MEYLRFRCCRVFLTVMGLLCAALFVAPSCTARAERSPKIIGPCWVVEVVDSDTLAVRLPDDRVEQVRYIGADSPELANEAFLGPEAHEANVELTADSGGPGTGGMMSWYAPR